MEKGQKIPRGGLRHLPQDLDPMRIIIPAEVAFDLGKMQKVLGNFAERLGCGNCLSGANCLFMIERNFVVNPESLEIEGWR
jgi:hypothetical protein